MSGPDATLLRLMRRNDRIAGAAILLLLAIIAGAVLRQGRRATSESPYQQPQSRSVAELQPPARLLGEWSLAKTTPYTPENLYEYINGQAPQYLAFGFRYLVSAEYESKAQPTVPLRVDFYNMGERRNAYGIFADMRSPEEQAERIGNAGSISGNMAACWKGEYYIRVQALTDTDAADTVRKAAVEVAALIYDSRGELIEFEAFPRDGLVPETLAFRKTAPLGLSYLSEAFIAEYDKNGERFRLFFCDAESAERARLAMREHAAFLRAKGRLQEEKAEPDELLTWGSDKYLGPILMISRGRVLAGVNRVGDRARAETLARELLASAEAALKSAEANGNAGN